MTPSSIRDAKFAEIYGSLTGLRSQVYYALQTHGPQTTLRLAELSGISPWTVRPRVCELCKIGLARLCGDKRGIEGVYEFVPLAAAVDAAAAAATPRDEQMALL